MTVNINDVKINKIGDEITSDEFKNLVYMWVQNYRSNGDKCAPASRLHKHILKYSKDSTIVATLDEELIGFVSVSVRDGVNLIEFAFTKQKYRGFGVATKLYEYAIKKLGADEIELSFGRIKGRISYWKALGFQSFKKRPDQGYSHKSICFLSQKDRCDNIMANPLQKDVLHQFLKFQDGYKPNWDEFIQSPERMNAFCDISISEFSNDNCPPNTKLGNSL